MKRLPLFLLSLLLIFLCLSLPACDRSEYSLTVNGHKVLLSEPLQESYRAGETVTVQVGGVGYQLQIGGETCNGDLLAYLNGQLLDTTPQTTDGGYCRYDFTMPAQDSTLTFQVVGMQWGLTVEGETELLWEPVPDSFRAGEQVTVRTEALQDAYVVLRLNGEAVKDTLPSAGTYTIFTFTMPNQNSTLQVKLVSVSPPPAP